MIESTTDISSEMNSMEAELEQNGSLCRCRLELMKRQNVPKLKFPIYKVSFADKLQRKLEVNSLRNLKPA